MGAHASGQKLSFPKSLKNTQGGYTRKMTITSPDATDLPTALTLLNEIKAAINASGHITADIAAGGNDK